MNRHHVDLSKYSKKELGKAWCDLNCFRWNDIFGPKPVGWDIMTDREKHKCEEYRTRMQQLDNILSPEEVSMYWWTIELGRTYEAWLDWYYKGKEKI